MASNLPFAEMIRSCKCFEHMSKTPTPLDWINSDAELYIVKPV